MFRKLDSEVKAVHKTMYQVSLSISPQTQTVQPADLPQHEKVNPADLPQHEKANPADSFVDLSRGRKVLDTSKDSPVITLCRDLLSKLKTIAKINPVDTATTPAPIAARR